MGRDSTCDITLTDAGISRRHAIFFPVKDNVKLEDQKSNNGTFVNDVKTRIPKDAHTFLKDNDVIYFGKREYAWRLKKVEISVITTKLDPRDNLELKSLLRVLNGNQVLSDWSNIVTHLVAPDINFTIKFLLALVNCVPIVNLDFFRDTVAQVRTSGTLPDVSKYIPKVAQGFPEVCEFGVKAERKALFSGLVFIFLEQLQMNMFQKIITCAGGSVSMWDKKKSSIIRVASRVIGDSKSEPEHQEVADYLLGKGRRLIPATEIGMAIATVSIERHCNPKYNPEVGHILALETPFVQGCNSSDVICMEEVPETIVVDDDDSVEEPAEVINEAAEKTKMIVCDKTVVSSTEVPETVTDSQQRTTNNMFQFPDDDDDDSFNERSQQILDLVDQHSSQASNKRKHSNGSDADNQDPPQAKKQNSQSQNISSASRFNSSQFIARPSQKLQSQATVSRPPPRSAPEPAKRTLADFLAKDDDDDSEDELLNFKKKAKTTTTTRAAKKPIPTLLRSIDEPDKSNSELDGPLKPPPPEVERFRISQLTGWLSKTLQSNCSIKAESLDETRAWIAPLLNCVQVKEILVDLSNCSRNRTSSTVEHPSNVTANLSGKRNFKSFKKQCFLKDSLLDPESTKTKSVLITENL